MPKNKAIKDRKVRKESSRATGSAFGPRVPANTTQRGGWKILDASSIRPDDSEEEQADLYIAFGKQLSEGIP